jgi:DNA-binding transcriptional ArsR family regulator
VPENLIEAVTHRTLAEVKADLFRALAHPARIRILEVLVAQERPVRELQEQVGIGASHLSQQLAVLRRAGLVTTRRQGTSVIYALSDPQTVQLLEVAKQILITSLTASSEVLADLRSV